MKISPLDLTPLHDCVTQDPLARKNAERLVAERGLTVSDTVVRQAVETEGIFPFGGPTRTAYASGTTFALSGSALLLEVAPPAIAEPLARNGAFLKNPRSRVRYTYLSNAKRVFAPWKSVAYDAQLMRRVHERIGSSALKTDGVRWVWAGMTRAILLHRELFVKQDPKTDPELESQYQEYKRIAYVVGLRERDLPETVQDFHDYFARKANELEISNDSIRLANSILGVLPEVASEFLGKHPDVGDAIRVITSGTLPDRVRSQYNLGLDPELRLPKVTAADVNAACGVIDWHVATKHYELAENARKRLAEFAPLGLDAQRRGAHNAFQ